MNSDILIFDGGVGTELIRRGVKCPPPLWATIGMFYPEVLKEIYTDYLNAGVKGLTTNTFRTGWLDIEKSHLNMHQFESLNQSAIEIIQEVIQSSDKAGKVMTIGSIGSLVDCYEPATLSSDSDHIKESHSPQFELFLNQKHVDVILCETLGNFSEIKSLMELWNRHSETKKQLWVSLLCKDENTLFDGTPLTRLLGFLETYRSRFNALGFNCVAPDQISSLLKRHAKKISKFSNVLAYGHLGQQNTQGQWVHENVCTPEEYASHTKTWINLGATVIGGCCGTTPSHIKAVVSQLIP
jgi:homocysteine S-methyltransferase